VKLGLVVDKSSPHFFTRIRVLARSSVAVALAALALAGWQYAGGSQVVWQQRCQRLRPAGSRSANEY